MTTQQGKANTLAILGFLAPFIAAGITCGLLLIAGDNFRTSGVFMIYQSVIPLILVLGMFLGIRSIPRIHELGDRDYAHTGLFLNLFFLGVFLLSCIYFH